MTQAERDGGPTVKDKAFMLERLQLREQSPLRRRERLQLRFEGAHLTLKSLYGQGRYPTVLGQPQAVMPKVPRARTEFARSCQGQGRSEQGGADFFLKFNRVGERSLFEHLSDHAPGKLEGIVWFLPPQVLLGQRMQERLIGAQPPQTILTD